MKAIVFERNGPPEVLQLQEIPQPVPKDNDVLIKIYATTVTIEDVNMRRSSGSIRQVKPMKSILGTCLAGEVETLGKNVKRFRQVDQVYGFTGFFGRMGTHAEYICMSEKED